MLSNDLFVLKYSVLGSAMLTLTGCGEPACGGYATAANYPAR